MAAGDQEVSTELRSDTDVKQEELSKEFQQQKALYIVQLIDARMGIGWTENLAKKLGEKVG